MKGAEKSTRTHKKKVGRYKTHASVTLKQKLVNYNMMDTDTERSERGEYVYMCECLVE